MSVEEILKLKNKLKIAEYQYQYEIHPLFEI